jgi:hypothetical protein
LRAVRLLHYCANRTSTPPNAIRVTCPNTHRAKDARSQPDTLPDPFTQILTERGPEGIQSQPTRLKN